MVAKATSEDILPVVSDPVSSSRGTYGQTAKLLEYGYVDMGALSSYESFAISATEIIESFAKLPFYDADVVALVRESSLLLRPFVREEPSELVFFQFYSNYLEHDFEQLLALLVKGHAYVEQNGTGKRVELNSLETANLVRLKLCIFGNFVQALKMPLGNSLLLLFFTYDFLYNCITKCGMGLERIAFAPNVGFGLVPLECA